MVYPVGLSRLRTAWDDGSRAERCRKGEKVRVLGGFQPISDTFEGFFGRIALFSSGDGIQLCNDWPERKSILPVNPPEPPPGTALTQVRCPKGHTQWVITSDDDPIGVHHLTCPECGIKYTLVMGRRQTDSR